MTSDIDIEALLSRRIPPVGGNGRDWWLVLSQFRVLLKRLSAMPIVQLDGTCNRILRQMVEAPSMAEVNDLMTQLSTRVRELLIASGADPDDLARRGLGQGQRGRASLKTSQDRNLHVMGEAPPTRGRTRIKL
jgi:hypothetical protein